ncbi:bacillithiol biosynthesis cysteine-adding enzyme BshC [Cyclobacterium lianum]|uniref:Putative cysteine ligase BshC n=1 Tax=Cyclobacterium lianum TaxID=388280 RepID=A0A1M7IEE7_9BACT|nr:bacillithiol biosynthesis cysteine-adding enzyme BshC [Cyclobacterium lianum]SHM39142.1 bacillithiol biosynthesis cysteine-adding enzyme BshC [Cyclobacterium lianum]
MLKSTVDPACTGLFSPLFLDYIQDKKSLRKFYQEFPNLKHFEKVVSEKTFSTEKRETLVQVLTAQYSGFETSEVSRNIEKLRKENTFTVTTGHQLNLMTGPAYFIYKIVSTILLARKLKENFPSFHFVPIYWMASEDHDFEEINHFHFDGTEYRWESDQRGPVGEFTLDDGLRELIQQWDFLPDFFREAYVGSKSLKEAVRKYVHHLFAEQGLVILDANDRLLKSSFLSVIQDDLFSQKANELINQRNAALEAEGYKTQVYPREINFFYMEPGRRERLINHQGIFRTHDGENQWTAEEMSQLLQDSPEKFSPNVVMRPIYQELILPNLAYLGGPAEVAYWFQLKGVFDHYQVDFPFLLPRNFALVVPVEVQRKIDKLNLQHPDLFLPMDRLRIDYVYRHAKSDIQLMQEKEKLEKLFFSVEEKASDLDSTLVYAVNAALKRTEKILEQVEVKFRKAAERKQGDAIRQIAAVKEALFPQGTLQERKVNFLEFYLKDKNFIDHLYKTFDPLDFNFIILQEDGREGETKKDLQV